jgi:hypothetical protein
MLFFGSNNVAAFLGKMGFGIFRFFSCQLVTHQVVNFHLWLSHYTRRT